MSDYCNGDDHLYIYEPDGAPPLRCVCGEVWYEPPPPLPWWERIKLWWKIRHWLPMLLPLMAVTALLCASGCHPRIAFINEAEHAGLNADEQRWMSETTAYLQRINGVLVEHEDRLDILETDAEATVAPTPQCER